MSDPAQSAEDCIREIRAVLDDWNLGNVTDDALIALDEIRKIVSRVESS